MKTNDAQKVADVISGFVNGMGNRVEDVVEHLSHEHRTLQQGVTRFCVAWLERCAKMHDEHDYDLRNEASAELGHQFMKRMNSQERAVPFI